MSERLPDLSNVELAFLDVDNHIVDTGTKLLQYHIDLYYSVMGRWPSDQFVETAASLIGNRAEYVMNVLYQNESLPEGITVNNLAASYKAKAQADQEPGGLIPGVPEELERLAQAGLRMRINTSRGANLIGALTSGEVNPYLFEAMAVPLEGELPSIPGIEIRRFASKTEAIQYGLGGVALRNATMSGDSPSDITHGNAAGVITIGVPYGRISAEDLAEAGADYLAENFLQMGRMLRP